MSNLQNDCGIIKIMKSPLVKFVAFKAGFPSGEPALKVRKNNE